MIANKYIMTKIVGDSKQITIPVQMNWDMVGQDMAIEVYNQEVIKKVIGEPYDFEINKFGHALDENNETKINYEFYFYSGGSLSNVNNWNMSYISEGFTTQEIYYYSNSFQNSFFKLDFYDSMENIRQTNYITIILPTQQGLYMESKVGRTSVNIKKPKYILDYVGDIEGFFIYWLKSRKFLDITKFYMTAKFYNAKLGGFTKMMNKPQSEIIGNKYFFEQTDFFYYKVDLNYEEQTYKVSDMKDNRVGTTTPIKWYEYVNPPDGLL